MQHIIDLIFKNNDALGALIFCGAACIGQVLHAVKKWSEGDASGVGGWFGTNLRRTIGAVIGNLGFMLVFIQTGILGPLLTLPNGWWAIFLFGFMNGFSADSALNKGAREQWSAEKRAAAEAPKP